MSEPRPSWMPDWEVILNAIDQGDNAVRVLDRLLLATGLRAQIEALCSISGKDVIEIGVAIGDRLDALYARLTELEAKP